MTLDRAAEKLRGPPKSPVRLKIMRSGFKEPKEFKIVRDVIKISVGTFAYRRRRHRLYKDHPVQRANL